jgi:hypothetical protein
MTRPHLAGNGHQTMSASNEANKFAAWAGDGPPGRKAPNLWTAASPIHFQFVNGHFDHAIKGPYRDNIGTTPPIDDL